MKRYTKEFMGKCVKCINFFTDSKMFVREATKTNGFYFLKYEDGMEITRGDIIDIIDRLYQIVKEHGLEYELADMLDLIPDN